MAADARAVAEEYFAALSARDVRAQLERAAA
jgi:hypothetical protein